MPTLTAARSTAFFTGTHQMALSAAQRTALSNEGLDTVDDFVDFKEEELKAAFKNMRSLTPPVLLPAKSTSRLLVASIAHSYYLTTKRAINHTNMHYRDVLREFFIEWKAIEDLNSKDNELKMPIISKNCPPIKWCESMKHYLDSTFGVRKIPLSYIIREKVEVDPEAPPAGQQPDPDVKYDPLVQGKAYGNSGSVLGDLIVRATHTHPLYKSDNAKVFSLIEQAARNSMILSTIKPYESKKDGRGAWNAIVTAHVGESKWIFIQRENSKWLINAKWQGKKQPLELFISQHRSKFQQLEEAATHIQFQVPAAHTRVGYLLEGIESDDAGLQAALAQVRNDHNGSRSDFEKAVQLLLPMCPYAKLQAAKDQTKVSFNISATEGTEEVKSKNGRGAKTGVDLRWHAPEELARLTTAQRKELDAYQSSPAGKKACKSARAQYFKDKKRKKEGGDGGGMSKKGLMARVAVLEKEKAERDRASEDLARETEIAAVLQTIGTPASRQPAQNSESQRSVLRQIMGIMARKESAPAKPAAK